MTDAIGWIGLGRIGTPMAGRVLDAGLPLQLWARHPAQADALRAAGAQWAPDAETLARSSSIVVTVLGGPDDVAALQSRLMPAARPGTLFIDLSTAAPATGQMGEQLAQAHGHDWLEAPVTGGVAGAERGTLTCFAGGSAAALQRATPLLQCFAQKIVPSGPAGSGYRLKLLNQVLVAGILMGLADGSRLAQAAGLEPQALLPVLGSGTAGSALLESYLPRMLPPGGAVGFTLGLLHKDLRLAAAEAAGLGLAAPLLQAAMAATEAAIERHGAQAGVQMLAA